VRQIGTGLAVPGQRNGQGHDRHQLPTIDRLEVDMTLVVRDTVDHVHIETHDAGRQSVDTN